MQHREHLTYASLYVFSKKVSTLAGCFRYSRTSCRGCSKEKESYRPFDTSFFLSTRRGTTSGTRPLFQKHFVYMYPGYKFIAFAVKLDLISKCLATKGKKKIARGIYLVQDGLKKGSEDLGTYSVRVRGHFL